MKEEMLNQLIEKTFAKLACPLQGNGVYSEIQQAVMAAYNLGKRQVEHVPESLLLSSNFMEN
jgi:hypothetical protein